LHFSSIVSSIALSGVGSRHHDGVCSLYPGRSGYSSSFDGQHTTVHSVFDVVFTPFIDSNGSVESLSFVCSTSIALYSDLSSFSTRAPLYIFGGPRRYSRPP
jgi:hypothetical protein